MNKLAANAIFPVASSTSSGTFCCIAQSYTSLQTHNSGAWKIQLHPAEASIAQDELAQLASLILSFSWSCFLMF
ncbi:hypothetical protein GW17_00017812 [Ensete ventricosum]|uniref:Uncharacterized protein n=1 Tax=Ensete ventricosum TaxID=4639 RepID=A0A427ASQ0_ENSVE|nr:hypothetical protein B296_00022836 [Ensete ventricosum]RWW18215.1 hypothetical protein GW17_00017812 [Ensete ventricosum]RZR80418.1 hypothetical protein BHM03_00006449 [Ensete ventricosum]